MANNHPSTTTPATANQAALVTVPRDVQQDLINVVQNNLVHEKDWSKLQTHADPHMPRMMLCGLPPRRLYVHPDEQIEIIKAEASLIDEQSIPQPPELEWVLPLHIREALSVRKWAAIFDSIETLPPGAAAAEAAVDDGGEMPEWKKWRSVKRHKRLLVAVVQDDSTIVYYIVHDGIVKPRQN